MRATASKTALLGFCQFWAREDAVWSDRPPSEYADRGTRFHHAIAHYVDSRVGAAKDVITTTPLVADDIRKEYDHATKWVDAFIPIGSTALVLCETAYAWDPNTDTAQAVGKDRDYSKAADRFCGTTDITIVSMIEGKAVAVIVYDWKLSIFEVEAEPQLRSLALMAARTYGVEYASAAALDVTETGVVETARVELDAFDLAAHAGELTDQLLQSKDAKPMPGSHCGECYCPAKLTCPEGNAATTQLVDVIPADSLVRKAAFKLSDPIETAEHAAWAVDVIRLVNARIETIKDDIKAKCPKDGWQLADGRVLREGFCKAQAFDKHKALALCKQLGATDAQLASLNYTFDKSQGLRVAGANTKSKPRVKKDGVAA